MIKFSSTVERILSSGNIEYFFFLKIGNEITATTAPFDVVIGGVTYSHFEGIIELSPPNFSDTVDRSTYKIAFSDSDFSLKSYFESNSSGDNVKVYVGFYNNLGETINGIEEGMYFNTLTDCILIYGGAVDAKAYEIDLVDNYVRGVIECSSPMADLDLVRSLYTTKDALKLQYPTDTSFDHVYDGAAAVNLKWGKA